MCDITYATAQALHSDKQFLVLSEAAASLGEIVRAGLPALEARERALNVTNTLRISLAEEIGLL